MFWFNNIMIFDIFSCTNSNQSQWGIDEVHAVFHDCSLHEYAYLGSPVFNRNGHFVAMTYADQGRLHAWTVPRLQDEVLKKFNR